MPAGSLDPGETALQAAWRELAEETGYRASSWRKLIEFFPSPGFLDEKMTLFLAEKVRSGEPSPESDEKIRVRPFHSAEWQDMIRSGQIRDAKTLVGLLYWRWIESQGPIRAARARFGRVSKRPPSAGSPSRTLGDAP